MTIRPLPWLASLMLAVTCVTTGSAQQLDGPPKDLKAAAEQLFVAYGQAISRPLPAAIAGFYAPTGIVVRTLNGTTRRMTRVALDSMYRLRWRPPTYFRFDSLTYDSISPSQVLVSGRFRWLAAGSSDTLPFLYAALLEAADSGMVIRFEHETPFPRQ